MYSFGEKLRELRTKTELSQGELAKVLNTEYGTSMNKGMISKWENEREEPRMDTIRILAAFFNVTLDELMGLNIDETNDLPKESPVDIADELEKLINHLKSDEVLYFQGLDMNKNIKDTLKVSLDNLMLLTKQITNSSE
ncbi:helix-turn-helix domain-containing protein [Paenibacillus agilis]|nr:helix-turn-helix transcriptional regulator [Paenibacillus agilis]